MSIKLLHQVGHNSNWNINSFTEHKCGDGLIFSPVHQSMSQIDNYSNDLKIKSFFDPQFYLPNSQKKKLNSYPFFPEKISGGFITGDFSLIALEAAKQCIQFQSEQNFDRFIMPARFFDQMIPDYTTKQDAYSVHPFLQELQNANVDKPIYLTLPITSHMIESSVYRTMLLNWVTSFPEINGLYLIVANDRPTKQIQSTDFLNSYLEMLRELKSVGLDLVLGYSNTESLVYSLIDNCEFTFGTFENTRMFSVDKFVVTDEERRGPKARIYLPGLLNWVQFSQAKEIKQTSPELWEKLYVPTTFAEAALNAPVEPTFNQSDLYYHHFTCFYEQFCTLRELTSVDRYHKLRQWIKDAMVLYEEISQLPVDIEKHGNGDHLQPWLDSINYYYRNYLK